MAWSTIRKATAKDEKKMFEAAARFCSNHNIDTGGFDTCELAIECAIDKENRKGSRKLAYAWNRVVRRALGHSNAQGIAYGCVGYHVD